MGKDYVFSYRGSEVVFNDIGEMYGRYFSNGQFYESEFLEYISSLNINGTYLDIGCNRANHMVFFAKFTKAEKVIGFEPVPRYADRIRQTIADNRIDSKAELLELAIAEAGGALELEFMGTVYDVTAATIDSLHIPNISLIKLDIEGMELSALKGANETLRRWRPILFIEALNGDEFTRIDDYLSKLGYSHTGRVFNASPTYEFKSI